MTRVRLIIVLAVAGAALAGYLLFGNDKPRMYVQQHIRAYDAQMPLPPKGSVPQESPQAVAFVPVEPGNIQRGSVYYAYYCLPCHGERGDGNGPVGESYLPRPSDLRTAKVQAYSDQKLLDAMLKGDGHEPVMSSTVRREHRGYLVAYVRSLGNGKH